MKTIRKFIKAIAAFMFLNTLCYIFYPTAALALTSGPTAPEYSSFEPFDTTDMVNMSSGDMAYNIPLFEIPGPAGGYPLSMSYHAGILAKEEASWVGLGWTFNPGAINRNVKGFADDIYNQSNTNSVYWSGGETTVVDFNFGFPAGLTAGISVGFDTYQGVGVGASAGFSAGFYSLNASVGPYGGVGIGQSIGISSKMFTNSTQKALNISGAISVNSNSNKASGSIGISKNGMGASMTSAGNLSFNTPFGSMGVGSSIHNAKSGNISTQTNSFQVPLPFVTLGYSKTRYWINESSTVFGNGSLYFPDSKITDRTWYDDKSFDTYTLLDNGVAGGVIENKNADKLQGGTFPNIDDYMVSAQGLSGKMSPHLFKAHMARQNVKNDNERVITNYTLGNASDYGLNVGFRFEDEFSNKYLYSEGSQKLAGLNLSYSFDGEETFGDGEFESFIDNRLTSSRNIEFLLNSEITSFNSDLAADNDIDNTSLKAYQVGFVETKSKGFNRTSADVNQVGAFVITNSSGVRYHFSLPVYNKGEYYRSQKISDSEGNLFNTTTKPGSYAYTWLLTAVTGPDFVDRGSIGVLDEDDWGYWVKFDYGKWTDSYNWRNPDTGYNMDFDTEFENFSYGTKELYYLNSISTASHTGLFLKEMREDAKGVSNRYNGGFDASYPAIISAPNDLIYREPVVPTSTLKLKEMVLFSNDKLNDFLSDVGANDLDELYSISNEDVFVAYGFGKTKSYNAPYFYKNVLDSKDITSSELESNCLRKINLVTDYSLRPESVNSFVFTPGQNTSDQKNGVLTLNAIERFGKEGKGGLPPNKFYYDDIKWESARIANNTTLQNASGLEIGDLIVVQQGSEKGYYLISGSSFGNYQLKQIGGYQLPINSTISVQYSTTKNAPYSTDNYDNWGHYKSDFDQDLNENSRNVGRLTSNVSSQSADVWSLRGIESPLGSHISFDYSADEYDAVLSGATDLIISDAVAISGNRVRLTFLNEFGSSVLSGLNNQKLKLLLTLRYYGVGRAASGWGRYFCDGQTQIAAYYWKTVEEEVTVKATGANYLDVENTALYNQVETIYGEKYYNSETGDIRSVTRLDDGFFFNQKGDVVAGTIAIDKAVQLNNVGGGLKIDAITVSDGINPVSRTRYNYSGGATSFEPIGFDIPFNHLLDVEVNTCMEEVEELKINEFMELYHDEVLDGYVDLLSISSELPAPGVLYKNVQVYEDVYKNGQWLQRPNHSESEFRTYESDMVQLTRTEPEKAGVDIIYGSQSIYRDSVKTRNVYVKNYTAMIGSLVAQRSYDTDENIIQETKHHYLADENNLDGSYLSALASQFNNQGYLEETFSDAKYVKQDYSIPNSLGPGQPSVNRPAHHLLGVITKRQKVPNVLLGTTTTNYFTGQSYSTNYLEYDFYTGQPTVVYDQDIAGRKMISKSIPAYRLEKYGPSSGTPEYTARQYEKMGLKDMDQDNLNMLTQEGANYVYLMPDNFDYQTQDWNTVSQRKLISAGIQTWSDQIDVHGQGIQSGIFRKSANYSWVGDGESYNDDGTYPLSGFSEYKFPSNGNNEIDDQGWRKNSQITYYDVNSHSLEAMDLNGNYSAMKLDYNQDYVLATGTNVGYDGFASSGFELNGASGLSFSGNIVIPELGGHTGEYSLKMSSGSQAYYELNQEDINTGSYVVSFWAKADSGIPSVFYAIDNSSNQIVSTSPDINQRVELEGVEWQYVSIKVDLPDRYTNIDIGLTANNLSFIDDLRIHPLNSVVTSYVYNEWGELSTILNKNNLATYFYYDELGRLNSVWTESFQYGKRKISESTITYGHQQ